MGFIEALNETTKACPIRLDPFPNWMRDPPINGLNLFIAILFSTYIFLALAIICDNYLVPSVERLCYKLNVPYDIGGATFLAAATSAPELFVSLVAAIFTQSDMGVSTIVGSAVFNILCVIGICGIFTKEALSLDWWPVTREILWYVLSVILLAVILIDHKVNLWESILLMVAFVVNIIVLVFDKKLRKLFKKTQDEEHVQEIEDEDAIRTVKERICILPREKSKCGKVFWVICYPLYVLYSLTIPSINIFFPGTLIVSVLYIAVLCYLVSWFCTVIGFNLMLPDAVMGLTVLAAGTSVPEAVSSLVVSQQGLGAMAVSNAIGSNTFDILICLGLPWTIQNIKDRKSVSVDTKGMLFVIIALLTTAILMGFSLAVSKFKLGRLLGWIYIIFFFIFIIVGCWVFIYMCRN